MSKWQLHGFKYSARLATIQLVVSDRATFLLRAKALSEVDFYIIALKESNKYLKNDYSYRFSKKSFKLLNDLIGKA